jgi:cytochrome b561
MQWRDSKNGYGWISIALHWASAATVIAMFMLGEQFEDLPRSPERSYWLGLHIGLGTILLPLLCVRVVARLMQGKPSAQPQPKPLRLLAALVHFGLLGTVAILAVSGPLAVWSGGHALNTLGWFEIASPWAPNPRLRSALGTVHVMAVKLLLGLFCLHIAGVLKHVVFNRDGTLMRMLRAR